MSAVIFSFRDSNMAGQEWRWSFGLHRSPEGTFTLMALQEFDDPADFGDELPIAPGIGLRNGVEIYERFAAQLEEAGIDFDGKGLTAVANRIAHIDPQAAKRTSSADRRRCEIAPRAKKHAQRTSAPCSSSPSWTR